jgi:DNA-binding NtrC family response regulator
MERIAILVVDDKAEVHQSVRLALGEIAEVASTATPHELDMLVRGAGFDCVLLDMNFVPAERSGVEGLSALDRIRSADPALSVVFMTAYGAVSLAVESLKRGADDFLLKPWRNDVLLAAVRAAADRTRAARGGTRLDALERSAIAAALERNEGNVARTATSLGLSRPALYRRMAKHGL